mgnify:CR=1 FL=1
MFLGPAVVIVGNDDDLIDATQHLLGPYQANVTIL